MLAGIYVPGRSMLHRAPAWIKLVGLLLLSTALVAWRSPITVGLTALVVLGLYAVAGLLPRLRAQVWPLRWLVLVLVPFQLVLAGPRAAVVVVGTLLVAVAGAALVSLTTKVSEMLTVLTVVLTPLRFLGVDRDRVALTLTLAIRAVPVLAGVFAQARDARRARGLERSATALVSPLVVLTLRQADRIGDALAARGVDD